MEIRLVRHGQSQANTGEVDPRAVGDHAIALTALGREQAREAGARIGADVVRGSLVYRSPYHRTRQTLDGLLQGAGVTGSDVRVFEDPRLREVEHGYQDVEAQESMRAVHGWFYYRFDGGESPADCYDRTSAALESIMRQSRRKGVRNVLIVTHGLTIRCFVMRFLHLTVDQFCTLANPRNCDVVTLAHADALAAPQFRSGRWGVEGLRLRGTRS